MTIDLAPDSRRRGKSVDYRRPIGALLVQASANPIHGLLHLAVEADTFTSSIMIDEEMTVASQSSVFDASAFFPAAHVLVSAIVPFHELTTELPSQRVASRSSIYAYGQLRRVAW
jgi:hypothetical protein